MNDFIVIDKNNLIDWFNEKYRDDNAKPIRQHFKKVNKPPNADYDIYYYLDLDFYKKEGVEYTYCYPHGVSHGLMLVKGSLSRDYHETTEVLFEHLNEEKILRKAIELGYIKELEK